MVNIFLHYWATKTSHVLSSQFSYTICGAYIFNNFLTTHCHFVIHIIISGPSFKIITGDYELHDGGERTETIHQRE